MLSLTTLAGCGSHVDEPSSPTTSNSTANPPVDEPGSPTTSNPPEDPTVDETSVALAGVDENLERLRALELFEVGELIVAMPLEATNCYGIPPCPGSEDAVRAAEADAARQLEELVDLRQRRRLPTRM